LQGLTIVAVLFPFGPSRHQSPNRLFNWTGSAALATPALSSATPNTAPTTTRARRTPPIHRDSCISAPSASPPLARCGRARAAPADRSDRPPAPTVDPRALTSFRRCSIVAHHRMRRNITPSQREPPPSPTGHHSPYHRRAGSPAQARRTRTAAAQRAAPLSAIMVRDTAGITSCSQERECGACKRSHPLPFSAVESQPHWMRRYAGQRSCRAQTAARRERWPDASHAPTSPAGTPFSPKASPATGGTSWCPAR
jgi:hypothetical protein